VAGERARAESQAAQAEIEEVRAELAEARGDAAAEDAASQARGQLAAAALAAAAAAAARAAADHAAALDGAHIESAAAAAAAAVAAAEHASELHGVRARLAESLHAHGARTATLERAHAELGSAQAQLAEAEAELGVTRAKLRNRIPSNSRHEGSKCTSVTWQTIICQAHLGLLLALLGRGSACLAAAGAIAPVGVAAGAVGRQILDRLDHAELNHLPAVLRRVGHGRCYSPRHSKPFNTSQEGDRTLVNDVADNRPGL